MKKIIIYSEIDWSFLDQRHHHLARYFASNGYHVVFVERVFSRVPKLSTLLKKIFRKHKTSPKNIPKNIFLRRSTFLPNTLTIFFITNYLIWFFFERNKQQDAYIYSFVDNPIIAGGVFKRYAKYEKSFFDIIHNWWEFPWNNSKHKMLVENCLNVFDKIITDSPKIHKKLSQRKIDSYLMLPGVSENWIKDDIDKNFEKAKPVFFGNLRTNSDIGLIKIISKLYGIDVYGIIDSELENKIEGLNYKGSVNSKVLPKAISQYNIIVLPYDKKSFSLSISPAKYFESLATGCLIITRASFEDLPGFNEFCLKLEDRTDTYPDDIMDALNNHHNLVRPQFNYAKNNTWDIRFKSLCKYLEISHE